METKKVFAGIYKYKGEPNELADFAILYGETLCFIEDGINDIFSDCEVGGLNDMELVEGYSLAVKASEKKWQIRDSGRKNQADYIIAEGNFGDNFVKSLKPFKIVLS